MTVVPIHHVSVDDRGVAFVSGTSLKVADIVVDAYAWNLTPEQIQENYPHLSLSEIHAALAYYHDHQAEIDRQLADADREWRQLRADNPNPLSRECFQRRLDNKALELLAFAGIPEDFVNWVYFLPL